MKVLVQAPATLANTILLANHIDQVVWGAGISRNNNRPSRPNRPTYNPPPPQYSNNNNTSRNNNNNYRDDPMEIDVMERRNQQNRQYHHHNNRNNNKIGRAHV